MSKANPFISASNSGEFSPRMDARIDFEKYGAAISRGLNLICMPQGGVTRRPGTRFIHETKDSTDFSTLIPFEPSAGVGYVIEAGDLYFRFYRNQGIVESAPNVPVEIVTPYLAADVDALRWTQSADVLYLFHIDYPVHKLSRLSDTSWTLTEVAFDDGPWGEINPDTDLSETNLLKNGTFDGGFAEWSEVTTGKGFVNYVSGSVIFQAYDTGGATGLISQSVTTPSSGSIHVLHFQIVGGGTVTLNLGTTLHGTQISTAVYSAGWYSVSFTPGASPFFVEFSAPSVPGTLVAPGVSGAFCYTTDADLLVPSATTGTITVTAQGSFTPFAATDVGRQIRFEYPGREPGWGTITVFTSSSVVTVLLSRKLPSTAPLEVWRLGAWSETTGYPAVGAFYQQRLFTARSARQPQTLWASQSSDFENMRPDSWVEGAKTVEDTNALNFTIASNRVSPIVWIIGARKLVVGAKSGQWSIASKGPVLTPSDFAADPQTSVAAAEIAPINIDTVGIFVQRALRALYDVGYSFEIDSFQANDLTILSDHITRGNVAQIVYQAEPFSVVWVRLETGTLACLTYKRGQNVVGWTPVVLGASAAGDASVEALAVIPGDDDPGQVFSSLNRNEVWMVVNRTIDGSTKRYIEMLEGVFDGPNRALYTDKDIWRAAMQAAQVDAFYIDCGLSYSGVPVSSVSGLDHLEGESVVVIADGAQQASQTVSGGAITLELAASVIHVGLTSTWIYRSVKLPFGSPTGQGVGQNKTIPGFIFVLRDTGVFEYSIDLAGEGEENAGDLVFQTVPFRTPGDVMGEATPLFSGEVIVDSGGGFSTDPRLVMRGEGGLPWTLIGFSPRVGEHEL